MKTGREKRRQSGRGEHGFRVRAYKNVNGKKKYGKYYLHCERQCDGQAVEFAHKNAGGHVYLGCLHRN